MTMVPFGVMALACIWLSRWPMEAPSIWNRATWYGEPEISPAPWPRPQSVWVAMCAPNQIATSQRPSSHIEPEDPTVNVSVTSVSESPA